MEGVAWENIIGATGSSYTTPVATIADDGKAFRCWAANMAGSVASDEVILTVIEPHPSGIISDDFCFIE